MTYIAQQTVLSTYEPILLVILHDYNVNRNDREQADSVYHYTDKISY